MVYDVVPDRAALVIVEVELFVTEHRAVHVPALVKAATV